MRTAQRYKQMMGKGEDSEEFFARLINKTDPKTNQEAADLLLLFNLQRRQALTRDITHDVRHRLLDDLIERLLRITGPVEPSEEYVGWF